MADAAVRTWGPYNATVVGIHDGDTIEVDVVLAKVGKEKADADLGFNVHRRSEGIVLARQSVRLYQCNAPELKTAAGQASLAYLQTLLAVGDHVKLTSYGWDKYGGRIDGVVVLADGRDVVTEMIAAGHAVAWGGQGPKPLPPAPTPATASRVARRYRKLPVVIEALQWTGRNWMAATDFDPAARAHPDHAHSLLIPTLEGEMTASPGDWLIRGVSGEVYPCKPDIFSQTYEAAG